MRHGQSTVLVSHLSNSSMFILFLLSVSFRRGTHAGHSAGAPPRLHLSRYLILDPCSVSVGSCDQRCTTITPAAVRV